MNKDTIPIQEEFISIQGEGLNLGAPYYFIRTGGCPLRCNFCDQESSWYVKQEWMKNIDDVCNEAIAKCAMHCIQWVTITGGEPLIYPKQVVAISQKLRRIGLKVHIETSGHYYHDDVHINSDLYSADAKTPCTGEVHKDGVVGLDRLRDCDQVKCLIATDDDMHYAHDINLRLNGRCTMVLQPFNLEILTDSTKNMTEQMASIRPRSKVTTSALRNRLMVSYINLLQLYMDRTQKGEYWQRTIITPQVHVLAFGNVPGT